jgi:formylglycine-generating enzyme required for sulfatase activity
MAYAEWLSQETGQKYRLPTEAEWEYAARAGTETRYWWGNTASHEYANYGTDKCCNGLATGKDRWKYTAPVGSFAPNAFGLYDTVGNVAEWTCSEYEEHYRGKELRCLDKSRVSLFVLRGGSWGLYPMRVRAAERDGREASYSSWVIGFRLVRD